MIWIGHLLGTYLESFRKIQKFVPKRPNSFCEFDLEWIFDMPPPWRVSKNRKDMPKRPSSSRKFDLD